MCYPDKYESSSELYINKKPVPAFLPGQEINFLRCHPAWRVAPTHTYVMPLSAKIRCPIYVGSFRLRYTVSQSVVLLYAVAKHFSDISPRPPKSIQPYIIRRALTIRGSLGDKR